MAADSRGSGQRDLGARCMRKSVYHRLIRPLDSRLRVARQMSELAASSERDLRDLGISRADFAAIRARTYQRRCTVDWQAVRLSGPAALPPAAAANRTWNGRLKRLSTRLLAVCC